MSTMDIYAAVARLRDVKRQIRRTVDDLIAAAPRLAVEDCTDDEHWFDLIELRTGERDRARAQVAELSRANAALRRRLIEAGIEP